jgi:hypothetical protein
MSSILNTGDSRSRADALDKIIKNMNNSSLYKPLGYKLDGSGCSCCLSEYFYLVCKVQNDYKIFVYDGYIRHTSTCAYIRCTCREPFIWKNINPQEKNFKESELEYFLGIVISIGDYAWKDDFELYLKQQKENEDIRKYNEDNDDNTDIPLKNYFYYFNNDK